MAQWRRGGMLWRRRALPRLWGRPTWGSPAATAGPTTATHWASQSWRDLVNTSTARQDFTCHALNIFHVNTSFKNIVTRATINFSEYITELIKQEAVPSVFNPLRFLSNLPKKGIPKVNCMLFFSHLDDMHGVGLLWKVTLWGLFLNSQNHCKSYWYWVIALHWDHRMKPYQAKFTIW